MGAAGGPSDGGTRGVELYPRKFFCERMLPILDSAHLTFALSRLFGPLQLQAVSSHYSGLVTLRNLFHAPQHHVSTTDPDTLSQIVYQSFFMMLSLVRSSPLCSQPLRSHLDDRCWACIATSTSLASAKASLTLSLLGLILNSATRQVCQLKVFEQFTGLSTNILVPND